MNIRCVGVAGLLVAAGLTASASGAIEVFSAQLTGAQESPPVVTTGSGWGVFTYDDVAHTLRMEVTFSGLVGNTTAAHIHASTALVPFTGNTGVAVHPPSLLNFPLGVTSGSYDQTFNMTLTSSYNASFITANGGTTAGAEAALLSTMRTGRAYFNIHSSFAGGGEIRGYIPTPGAAGVLGLAGLVAMRRRRN